MDTLLFVAQIALIILKVASVIAWSWWLVFMPLWVGISAVLLIIVLLIAGLGGAVLGTELIRKGIKGMKW